MNKKLLLIEQLKRLIGMLECDCDYTASYGQKRVELPEEKSTKYCKFKWIKQPHTKAELKRVIVDIKQLSTEVYKEVIK